jgi:type IV pilus assembly protein PilE
MKTTQKGFTLLELMIVVIIVAILSAIAVPAYSNYVTRGKIPEATSTLAALRVQMEQYFQDNRTYAGGPCSPAAGTTQYFDFSCTVAGTATAFTISAAGKADRGMGGFTYTIDQSNTKTSTIASPAGTTWQATQPNCWITQEGGTC